MGWLTGDEVDSRLADPGRIIEHINLVAFAGELGGGEGNCVVIPEGSRVHVRVEGIPERSWDTHSLVGESKRRVDGQDDEEDSVLHRVRHCWFLVCCCLEGR